MPKGRPKDPAAARRGTGRKPAKAAPPAVIEPAAVEVCGFEPPADLPEVAQQAWTLCVEEMQANRQLRESDLILLRAYVEAVYIHAEASAKIHEFGVLVAGPKGPMPNPMIRVQDNAARTIRLLSENLGLNPIARIRAGIMEIAGASMVMDIRERLVKQIAKG
ncbi:MAG: P27 family phage terminase small subunit [Ignavibacteriales bacterium]